MSYYNDVISTRYVKCQSVKDNRYIIVITALSPSGIVETCWSKKTDISHLYQTIKNTYSELNLFHIMFLLQKTVG